MIFYQPQPYRFNAKSQLNLNLLRVRDKTSIAAPATSAFFLLRGKIQIEPLLLLTTRLSIAHKTRSNQLPSRSLDLDGQINNFPKITSELQ